MTTQTALALWMGQRDMTDREMAAKLGVSRPIVSRLRRGERTPSYEMAVKLALVTKMPAATFRPELAAVA